MTKKIKTTDTNVEVNTSSIIVIEISNFSFEVDERYPWIEVYSIGGESKELVTEIDDEDLPIFTNHDALKIFALNWYFNNVEIVREISSCIGEGRNTVDLRGALEEVRLNLMAIDMNGDPGVDSFVNDSIEIINEALEGKQWGI